MGNYSNDDTQYMALMDAAATFARAHQLRPGIELSASQVAQLTSDVVWLVTQTVQLPDGSTTTALVPQVYLAPKRGDLAANGALLGGPQGAVISARDIQLALSGDLANSGTIAGRRLVDVSAANIASSDIQNTASYKADSVALSVGTSAGQNSAGIGNDSGSAASATKASISGIAGDKTARTGDAPTGIKPIFDQAAVRQEINGQTQITQAFGQNASRAVGYIGRHDAR